MRTTSVLFLFCSSLGFAQVWVKEHATWIFSYHFTQFGDPFEADEHFGYMKVQHVGDTIIQNKLCKKFDTKQYKFTGNPSDLGELESITHLEYNYTFVNEDTVFFYQNDQFQVLYNFDLQIGDSLPIHFLGEETGSCNDTSYTEIVDTGVVNLQGLDYFFIETMQNSLQTWYEMNGKFSERFGPFEGFLFPNYTASCSASGTQIYDYSILCFRDDEFEIDFSGNNTCPAYFLVSVEEKNQFDKIKIFPNPVSDFITIDGNIDGLDLKLVDAFGNVLRENKAQELFNLSFIPNGFYFLQFLHEGQIQSTKKLLVCR